jgi:hypothetical protein
MADIRLVQFEYAKQRRVAVVNEPYLTLLVPTITSSYLLFKDIIDNQKNAEQTISSLLTSEQLNYDDVYHSKNGFKILVPIDTVDIMHCIISGTGLTHKTSAENRQKMHDQEEAQALTDSMRMYLMGESGGKPIDGKIGAQPEWFYKGNGLSLKSHGELLGIPDFADDGGDEPEIAGVYLVSNKGIPHRIGFVQGNEFSDHVMEKKNYLYLAPSKLRACSIGPELILTQSFDFIPGVAKIIRNEKEVWTKEIKTGEAVMAHNLVNLEYHQFKYAQHRVPGQLHIHFFGTGAFSFADNVILETGDRMFIHFEGMGRPLVNPLFKDTNPQKFFSIKPLA